MELYILLSLPRRPYETRTIVSTKLTIRCLRKQEVGETKVWLMKSILKINRLPLVLLIRTGLKICGNAYVLLRSCRCPWGTHRKGRYFPGFHILQISHVITAKNICMRNFTTLPSAHLKNYDFINKYFTCLRKITNTINSWWFYWLRKWSYFEGQK